MSESDARGPLRTRTPRWLWAALIVSLALNLLVIGAGARAFFRSPFFADRLPGNYVRYVERLPADRRQALRNTIATVRPELRALRQELRRARREAAQVFGAEPFDKERFVAAQQRILDAELKFRQALQRPVPEIAAQLTAEERRAFLRWRAGRRTSAGRWLDEEDKADPKEAAPGKP